MIQWVENATVDLNYQTKEIEENMMMKMAESNEFR